MKPATILYVEDDEAIAFLTVDQLESNGFKVVYSQDGEKAWNAFVDNSIDLCLIDVMLPKLDGFSLAERIRQYDHQIPILFLTAKSLKEDRIKGLKLGADDYIIKPYSIEELILRMNVFLRRKNIQKDTSLKQITLGKYLFEPNNYRLICEGKEIQLTQRESDLLFFLADRQNEVIKRSLILEHIWGRDDYFLGRSLDVFISRLRKCLSEDDTIKIENIHGVGYALKNGNI
jgi:two-component system, OmpR family, response regulator VicR